MAGEYTEESLSEVYDQADIIGDVVKTWKKFALGKKTIVFGVNVAHIKHMTKEFNKHGISACQINAYQSPDERKEALDGFLIGNTKVLCSVEVATKGFDCAEVECVVLAVATKSHIKWEQTCGRSYRVFPGKESAIILDLGGNCERLGFPDSYAFYELDDGKKSKSKTKEKEKPEKLPKTCPSCLFLKPAGVKICPRCQFKPQFIQDIEVSDGTLEKLKRKNNRVYTKKEKQSWLNQLNTYCRDKGWREGASSQRYKQKFSVWPNAMEKGLYEPVGQEVMNFIKHQNIRYVKSKKRLQ